MKYTKYSFYILVGMQFLLNGNGLLSKDEYGGAFERQW